MGLNVQYFIINNHKIGKFLLGIFYFIEFKFEIELYMRIEKLMNLIK